ncbi:hypothetical protein FPOA_03699 [Fusarium poae]|uniref:Uncharacterized protein n=1 Tax=Fusarium poae TaxID=36050 RepID=A0A1B8ARH0_FUSPO|nr:hypothetical protein FPOA_03699 [Fusarium poae]
MKFTSTILALLTATSAFASAITPNQASRLEARRAAHWGKCNGTSCKVDGKNYGCTRGSCTRQSGGGDGAQCAKLGGSVCCPGGTQLGKGCRW